MQIAMIGDKIVPIKEAKQVYFDRGIYFGDGVYEVIRSYNGKIFALEEHLQRFKNSLAAIEITAVDIAQIRNKINKAFNAADIADAKIYFHITRGSALRNHTWDTQLEPNFFLTITEIEDLDKIKKEGISVSTYPDLRWKRCDIKSLNLLPNILARQDAVKKGNQEAIFVDENGFITEGSGTAFFAVFGDSLQTAPLTANILPSVTRKFAIQAGKNIGMKILEKSLTPEQALSGDELFIAVTTKDIVGVVRFDGKIISNGKPGKYTKLIMQEFLSFIA